MANEELLPTITEALNAYLPAFFECNPITTNSILQKVQHSAERRKHLPPIDSKQFHQLEKRLTKPEEDPKGWGTTAWLPASYQCRMQRRNGGEIRTQNEVWNLIPIRDESSAERLKRTSEDVIECTKRTRGKPGIPVDAVVIAQNQQDDLLLLIRRTDRPCGEDCPNPFADAVYRWDHISHELVRIVDDFDEIAWGPDTSENFVQKSQVERS